MISDRQYEGVALRKLRASKRMSQKEFATTVFGETEANAAKTLSKIENGIQALSAGQIAKIEAFFAVSMDDEVADVKRNEKAAPLALLTDKEYFGHLERFYEKACASPGPVSPKRGRRLAPAEVWFFHPLESLPILTSDTVRELWIRNLRRGIDKHFVWPLPITTSGDLVMYHDLAVDLINQLCAGKDQADIDGFGRIVFWACDDINGATNTAMEKRYNEYRNTSSSENLPLVFNKVLRLGSRRGFQGILCLDSVILNLAADQKLPRYAAEFLDDVGSEPNGAGSSGWLFKGGRTRTRLIELVRHLREFTEKESK